MQRVRALPPAVPRGTSHRTRTLARALATGWTALFTTVLVLSGIGEGGGVVGVAAHAIGALPFVLAVAFAWRHEWGGGWLLVALGGLFGLGFSALAVASNGVRAATLPIILFQIVPMLPFVVAGVLFVLAARGSHAT
jgi:hypothetical protein